MLHIDVSSIKLYRMQSSCGEFAIVDYLTIALSFFGDRLWIFGYIQIFKYAQVRSRLDSITSYYYIILLDANWQNHFAKRVNVNRHAN